MNVNFILSIWEHLKTRCTAGSCWFRQAGKSPAPFFLLCNPGKSKISTNKSSTSSPGASELVDDLFVCHCCCITSNVFFFCDWNHKATQQYYHYYCYYQTGEFKPRKEETLPAVCQCSPSAPILPICHRPQSSAAPAEGEGPSPRTR